MALRRQGSILTDIEEDRRRRRERRRNWWRMRERIFGQNVTCVEIQSHLNYIESLEEQSVNSGGSAICELRGYDRYLDGLGEVVVESSFPTDEMMSDELAELVLKFLKLLKKREREFRMKKDKTLIEFVKYGKLINGVEGGKEIFSDDDIRIMELVLKNQVCKVQRLKEVMAMVCELEEEIEEKKICNNKLRVVIVATLTVMIIFTFDKADVKLPSEARVLSFLFVLVAIVVWFVRYKQGKEFGSELQQMKARKMIYSHFQNNLGERLLNLYFLAQEMREEFLDGFADCDDLFLAPS